MEGIVLLGVDLPVLVGVNDLEQPLPARLPLVPLTGRKEAISVGVEFSGKSVSRAPVRGPVSFWFFGRLAVNALGEYDALKLRQVLLTLTDRWLMEGAVWMEAFKLTVAGWQCTCLAAGWLSRGLATECVLALVSCGGSRPT